MTGRLGIAALIALVAAVYLLRVDDVAGLYKDDAYYLVLAKALSQGDGYRLISSAATAIVPAAPPGYALVTAPMFWLGDFPGNLFWIKLLSILSMLGAGWFALRYWRDDRNVEPNHAVLIALLTVLTPGFVFLATSTTMPECLFVFAMLFAAHAIERAARSSGAARDVAIAGVSATAAWLVRAPGVAIVAAGAIVIFVRRGWRSSLLFVAVSVAGYAPWLAYASATAPTYAERQAHGGAFAFTYADLLQSQSGGDTRRAIGIGDWPRRIGNNLSNVFAHDLGAVFFPAGYRGFDESGLEVFMLSGETGLNAGSMGLGRGAVVLSLLATPIVIIGMLSLARRGIGVAEVVSVLTLALIMTVASRTYRYVLPLAPFAYAYFLAGVATMASRVSAGARQSATRIAAACLLLFFAAEHVVYAWQKYNGPTPPWIRDGKEVSSVTDFVRAQLPSQAHAVSTNPALLYLRTGHRAVAYADPVPENWPRWQSAGIGYAVALHAVPEPNPRLGYRLLFETGRLKLWVLDMRPIAEGVTESVSKP